MTIDVVGPAVPGSAEILTPDALAFVDRLAGRFEARRRDDLAVRKRGAARAGGGRHARAPAGDGRIRAAEWRVAPVPSDLTTGGSRSPGRPSRR